MTDQSEQLMIRVRESAMTAAEKTTMRLKLLAYTQTFRPRVTAAAAAWSWVHHHAAMTLALAALLVLGGTGVSAHNAGPNDTFYGFRLQVNDRIEGALAFNEDAQFDVQLRQIQRQLDAEEGAFDEALADDEQDERGEDSDNDEKSDEHRKDEKETGEDDDDRLEGDLELEAELRQMERELQLEASASIELEN